MKQRNFLFYGQKDGLNGSSLHKSDWTVMSFYISMTNNFCYSFRCSDDHNMFGFFFYYYYFKINRSTKRFGADQKRFEHLAFLNLAQNVVCLVWSFISESLVFIFLLLGPVERIDNRAQFSFFGAYSTVIKLWSRSSSGGAPWWSYWSAGITNTIGPTMGIEALKYISYPAQACYDLLPLFLTSSPHISVPASYHISLPKCHLKVYRMMPSCI